MKRTMGWALAAGFLLLFPCCKTDTTAPQPDRGTAAAPGEAPAESPAEVKEAPPAVDRPPVDASARKAAEGFLKALTVPDSPEGKRVLAETRWRQIMKFPEFREFLTLSEEMFPTDIPGVEGYKRKMKLVVPAKDRRPYVKPHMLIAYEDAREDTWKIFDFTADFDPEQESERACEEEALAEGEGTTPQARLMKCSYWLVMAGKVDEAGKMAQKANALYEELSDPDDEARYYKARADDTLDMISRIAGARL